MERCRGCATRLTPRVAQDSCRILGVSCWRSTDGFRKSRKRDTRAREYKKGGDSDARERMKQLVVPVMGWTHTRLHDRNRNKTRQIRFLCQGGTGFKGKLVTSRRGERCRWLTGSHDGVGDGPTDNEPIATKSRERCDEQLAEWPTLLSFLACSSSARPVLSLVRSICRGFVGICPDCVPREFRRWGSVGGCRDATTTLGCQWHDERLKRVGVASCCRRVEAAVSLTTSERGVKGLPCPVQRPVPSVFEAWKAWLGFCLGP